MPKLTSPADLEKLRTDIIARRDPDRRCITVCAGTGCLAYGSQEIFAAFGSEIDRLNLQDKVDLRRTGCHGFCGRGPVIVILPEKTCYLGAKESDIPDIVEQTVIGNKLVEHLLYKDFNTGEPCEHIDDIPFYQYQKRLLLDSNTQIDPKNVEDYIALGGYSALAQVLIQSRPEAVIQEITRANLRGRGGGGFPAGKKWQTTRSAPGEPKFVVVNADEGDPGAYMDRSLLEGNPHSILEGLIIGAYAIGSSAGFIYVRQEYPLAVENTEYALEQLRQLGLLGPDILGSGFDFDITIHRGAGAFVSGESSALMCAIEGQVGEPRPKYIHTSVKGLWENPTCLNNVETWANVPLIINKGADWYRTIGTENSKGTKIFSLVGKINNTGLVEVPMGITLRDIIYRIGGGIPGGKKFKAVQTGGPSGGVLPESMIDLSVDFDELYQAGSMMGSGGMIVMDEDICMVDTARYYTNFLTHESCGKCAPCREGLRQMLRIINNIAAGAGQPGDIELLEELSEFVMDASLCALGQTAPNPVLSTLKHFRDEYQAHINNKECPAGVCSALISFLIDPEDCISCGACAKNCPTDAISQAENEKYVIDQAQCIKCGTCFDVCPDKARAVKKVPGHSVTEAV